MRRSVLALATSTAILLFGGAPVVAQQGPDGPMMHGEQQEMKQRRDMMQQHQQQQQAPDTQDPDTRDQDSAESDRSNGWGMGRGYGRGWKHGSRRGYRQGRMRDSAWGPGRMMRPGMISPGMMRMMFILADTDGDGNLSLEEFQAAHERIFKAMDANKDGRVSPEEMRAFWMNLSDQQQ
jgi:hypothetical protein